MIDDTRLLFAMMKHEFGQNTMSRQPNISEESFDSWIRGFAERAGSSGIDKSVFHSSLDRVAPNPSVVSADRNQPETVVAAGDYLRRAMPPDRIARGAEFGTVLGEELSGIERKYGVERWIILAIWGVESDFGTNTGDYPVVEALATLACDGRRRDLAERELLDALRILENREVRKDEMLGSWAGAMGHTQFMPSSFLAFAVDHDGDGRRDIWNPSNPLDALASTANYLAQSGWKQGSPWGIEVGLPDDFDFRLADLRITKPASAWREQGITAADPAVGARLRGQCKAAVFLPAGATGPAFLVSRNFTVLRKYNASGIYALAVGLFGDRIAGEGAIRAEWPADVRPLSMKDVTTLQEKLRDLGFDPGKIDGLAGPDTHAAVRSFQEKAGLAPDGHVSNVIFEHLG
ncbi:MAG: lytic murein transglycosylase [Rhodobacteraceae bacterium]|nr:lytic murein transglycosylase [Paracoccaceae bacterium]